MLNNVYDHWERLVGAVIRREQLWKMFHDRSPSVSSISSDFSFDSQVLDVPFDFSSRAGTSRYQLPAVENSQKKEKSVKDIRRYSLIMSETSTINNEPYNHYLNGMTPSEIAVHFKEIYPEFGDLDVEEVLLQQESAYLYIQASGKEKVSTSDNGQTSNSSQFSAQENESQLALDEAFARSLELEDDLADSYSSEHVDTIVEWTDSSPRVTPARIAREDDIDPDIMNYEELLSLGEAVGNESKGLSDNLISRLPTLTFKYKAGLFSKKKKKEECVICYAEYKNGEELITLPCAHHYHSGCITHWLKLKKNCPVCQEEVRGE